MKKPSLIFAFILTIFNLFSQKQKVWLDADTGNEMDDLYAIARLVLDKNIDLVGLSSAHFNNADLLMFEKWNGYNTKGLKTAKESQRLNEQILKALNRMDIPHPMGSDRQMGLAWGRDDARDSPAARGIIKAAMSLPEGEKLDVLTLGALSNIGSAIKLEPKILGKIRCYSLGAKYNPATKVWNKSEFNIRNDLNAFDFLLDTEGFDWIIMPLEAAFPLQFQKDDTYARLDEKLAIDKILENRWKEHNPNDTKRIMWDLALVEAYLKPDKSQIVTATTPPENKQHPIKVYSKIDEKALTEDFWVILKRKY